MVQTSKSIEKLEKKSEIESKEKEIFFKKKTYIQQNIKQFKSTISLLHQDCIQIINNNKPTLKKQ